MTDDDTQAHAQESKPNPALKSLDALVGNWIDWMEGGFYLVHHVDIDYVGRKEFS